MTDTITRDQLTAVLRGLALADDTGDPGYYRALAATAMVFGLEKPALEIQRRSRRMVDGEIINMPPV